MSTGSKLDYTTVGDIDHRMNTLAEKWVELQAINKKYLHDMEQIQLFVYFAVTEAGFTPLEVSRLTPVSEQRINTIIKQVERRLGVKSK